jgi:hypothetical protein
MPAGGSSQTSGRRGAAALKRYSVRRSPFLFKAAGIPARAAVVLLFLLISPVPAAAQQTETPPTDTESPAGTAEPTSATDQRTAALPPPEVLSFSGSPLLLEFELKKPGRQPLDVVIEGAGSRLSYHIPPDPERDALEIKAAPFFSPGVYELALRVRRGDEAERRFPLEVGFVDFVWGRDNFRFGNNSDYESTVGSYSEILADWLEERFGIVDPAVRVLLADYMYGLFGKNTGRCYAFTGTQLRYWRWPELLPSYYDCAYDIRQKSSRYQRQMHFLQLDIVYDYFGAGGHRRAPPAVRRPAAGSGTGGAGVSAGAMRISTLGIQERTATHGEMEKVIAGIKAGRPVVIGLIGPELHHSMLVFGYIRNPAAGTVELLAANNWKSEERINVFSRDAHIVRIYLNEDRAVPAAEWRDSSGPRTRAIHILFALEVEKEYRHSADLLRRLLDGRREQLRTENRSVLVVENAKEAWITAGGEECTGYRENELRRELTEAAFHRVNRNFCFEYPADGEYQLELTDDEGVRILYYSPGRGGEKETAWLTSASVEEGQKEVSRRMRPGTAAPAWEETAATAE